jgi:hypothetical protein
VVPQGVDLHDVGVLEPGDGLGLRQEAGAELGAVVLAGQDDLQGAEAVEPDLAGQIDDAHPAAAQLGQDLAARDIREVVRRRTRGATRARPVPSGPQLDGPRIRPANELEPRGEVGEGRVDQPVLRREPDSVFRWLGSLSEAAAVVELQGQEMTEQRRAARVGRTAQEVFDPRPIAGAPGGLEAVADLVDLAPDLGLIEPVLSA